MFRKDRGLYKAPLFFMNININGVSWNVIYTSDYNNLKRSDGIITLGVTDVRLKTIYVYSNLNSYMRRKVLIHELTHAFIFSYDYCLPLDQEEFICSFVENYGIDIIKIYDYICNQSMPTISLESSY